MKKGNKTSNLKKKVLSKIYTIRNEVTSFFSRHKLRFIRFSVNLLIFGIAIGIGGLFYHSAFISGETKEIRDRLITLDAVDAKSVAVIVDFSKSPNEYASKDVISTLGAIAYLDPYAILKEDRLCYQSVTMQDSADYLQLDNGKVHFYGLSKRILEPQGDSFCPKPSEIPTFHSYNLDSTRHSKGVASYYYPFDTIELDTLIWVDAFYENDPQRQIKIIPTIVGEVDTGREWEVEITNTSLEDELSTGSRLQITYRRSLIYRILIPTVIFLIALVIVLSTRIKDTGTYIGSFLGLLFGIWSVREVILPSYITWQTILDPIFLIFYFILTVTVLYRFIISPYLINLE